MNGGGAVFAGCCMFGPGYTPIVLPIDLECFNLPTPFPQAVSTRQVGGACGTGAGISRWKSRLVVRWVGIEFGI